MRVGVYIDLSPSAMEQPETMEKVKQLTVVDHWLLMAEGRNGRRLYTPNDAARVRDGLPMPVGSTEPPDVRPVFWPSPERLAGAYFAWTGRVSAALCTRHWRADLEANWHGAAPYHGERLADHSPEVTMLYGNRDSKSYLRVARWAPLVEIQSYSTSSLIAQEPDAIPGLWQELCYSAGESIYGQPPALALAAYRQQGVMPAREQRSGALQAMVEAYRAAERLGAPEANYWSLRHILSISYAWEYFTRVLPSLRA